MVIRLAIRLAYSLKTGAQTPKRCKLLLYACKPPCRMA